ncbi:hypothetical protein AB7C35_16595 [Bacillus subtilis]|uniref:hypothetical protein n=1 Tax=Bacillus subtilis TaxID=1423 RepID=UPI00129D65A8|nr:hypothetical protein [Bacillus subtilis]QGI17709.1 hypothetical protein GII81_10345 [Bacillus subtilis]CAF1889325.1 hypothetical protein NRS6183_03129 [Bacillus subtilis]CAI6273873.1 hypothetical protein NRS6183_11310 [Bacillus subtilis]
MEKQILEAIQQLSKDIAEVKQDVKEIKNTVTRIEENEPEEVISMLKLINKNIERDHSYNDKKFSSLERRIHELEERLNN